MVVQWDLDLYDSVLFSRMPLDFQHQHIYSYREQCGTHETPRTNLDLKSDVCGQFSYSEDRRT